jgi:hypothetical protein
LNLINEVEREDIPVEGGGVEAVVVTVEIDVPGKSCQLTSQTIGRM